VGALILLIGAGTATYAIVDSNRDIPNHGAYGPVMWREQPVDKVFPKTLAPRENQKPATDPKRAQWRRVAISEQTSCQRAVQFRTLKTAENAGCKGALRATYVDPTGKVVGTVAVLAFPKSGRSDMLDYVERLDDKNVYPAVRAVHAPHSVAPGWNDAHRNAGKARMTTETDLPYAIMSVTGASDGRVAGKLPGKVASGNSSDHGPYEGAAQSLDDALDSHLSDLLMGDA